jgi:chloride channel protein, CIC family
MAGLLPWIAGWLRGNRFGLFFVALLVGLGAGFGAIAFRYLVYGFTWLLALPQLYGVGYR